LSLTEANYVFAGGHQHGINEFLKAFLTLRPHHINHGTSAFVPARTAAEKSVLRRLPMQFARIAILLAFLWPTVCFSQDTPTLSRDQLKAKVNQITPENTREQLRTLPRALRFEVLRQVLATKPDLNGLTNVSILGTTVSVDPQAVRDQGKADGTYSTFGAVFNVSATFGDAGAGSVPSAQNSIQTEAQGVISFESTHFGFVANNDKSHHPDFSFGGTVGLYPALVLENLSSSNTTVSQPNARPMFQSAFRWSLGPNLNFPIYDHGEAGIFVNLGQNFLVNQVSSFKQGDATIVATPVSNSVGRAAMFWEVGAQTRLLNVALSQAHIDKQSFLLPEFQLATGYRHDTRFRKSGDLGAYNNPEGRFFFRFFVSLNNIIDQRSSGTPNQPISFKFGVEYERPISDSRVPSATRYTVSADVDILKLFSPTSK
jgi:hypothetical protein